MEREERIREARSPPALGRKREGGRKRGRSAGLGSTAYTRSNEIHHDVRNFPPPRSAVGEQEHLEAGEEGPYLFNRRREKEKKTGSGSGIGKES